MKQLSLLLRNKPCDTCIASTLKYCSGCSGSRCVYCQGICNCETCHVICGYRNNRNDFLNDIASFSFHDNDVKQPIILPSFIPMIMKGSFDLSGYGNEIKMIAVTPRDLINNGRLSPTAKKGIHKFYNLPASTKVILVLTGKEYLLENLWMNHYKYSLFNELRNLGFYAITSTNLTVGYQHPRLMHLFNMRRNNLTYNALVNAGIQAIPDISWFNKDDLFRWIKWLKNNPVNYFSITTQCMKAGNRSLLNPLLEDLSHLIKGIGRNVYIMFIGPGNLRMINNLKSRFNDICVVSTSPFRKAMSGYVAYMEQDEIRFRKNTTRSKENLFIESVQIHQSAMNDDYIENTINLNPVMSKF